MDVGVVFKALATPFRAAWNASEAAQSLRDVERRRQREDIEMAEFLSSKGALPVIGGMVNDGGTLRPTDKARTVKYKTSNKEIAEFQLPTPEEQLKRTAGLEQSAFDYGTALRTAQGREATDQAVSRERGIQGVRTEADAARARAEQERDQLERERMGVDLPPGMAQALGIRGNLLNPALPVSADAPLPEQEPRRDYRFLPAELSQLATAVDRLRPEAARGTPHYETDAEGNVTAIVPDADGSFRQEKLGKVGKPQQSSNEGPTPYQQYQMGRDTQEDVRRTSERREGAAKFWQSQVDGYQNQQDALAAENTQLGAETQQFGTQLKGNLKKTDRIKLEAQLAQKQAKILANTTRFNAIERQKKAADLQRRQSMGESGDGGGGVTVTDPRGVKHRFPDQASADKFKALAGIP